MCAVVSSSVIFVLLNSDLSQYPDLLVMVLIRVCASCTQALRRADLYLRPHPLDVERRAEVESDLVTSPCSRIQTTLHSRHYTVQQEKTNIC